MRRLAAWLVCGLCAVPVASCQGRYGPSTEPVLVPQTKSLSPCPHTPAAVRDCCQCNPRLSATLDAARNIDVPQLVWAKFQRCVEVNGVAAAEGPEWRKSASVGLNGCLQREQVLDESVRDALMKAFDEARHVPEEVMKRWWECEELYRTRESCDPCLLSTRRFQVALRLDAPTGSQKLDRSDCRLESVQGQWCQRGYGGCAPSAYAPCSSLAVEVAADAVLWSVPEGAREGNCSAVLCCGPEECCAGS